MAASIRYLHRHKSEKQKLIANLISCSNSWAGINDLCFKYAAFPSRNLGNKKARQQSGKTIVY